MDEQIVVDVLIQLADLEEELLVAEATCERYTTRYADLHGLQEEYDDDVRTAEKSTSFTEVGFRGQEGEIELLEAKLLDRKSKLSGMSDARQCNALQDEISSLEQQIDLLETAALKMLGDIEQQQTDTSQARKDRDRQLTRGSKELDELRTAAEKSKAACEEIHQEIARLKALLPPKQAGHWQRLKNRLPTATARGTGGACSGCYLFLPAQVAIAVEKGKSIVQCPGCARFLVRGSWK